MASGVFNEDCCCECAKSCPILCNPMDCSPPDSSVNGISQARILEWLPFPSPGDLPYPRIEPASPSLLVDSLPLNHQMVYTCYHYSLLYGQRIFKDNLTPSKKSYMLIREPQTSLKFNTTGLLKSPAVVTKVFPAQTLSQAQASVRSVVTTCHH